MAQDVAIKIRSDTLNGEVNISGAKNSAAAIIPATLLAKGAVLRLEGLPQISDVKTFSEFIRRFKYQALAKWYRIEVDTTEIQNAALPNNKVESLRA
ncbi:hypothetical protein ACVXZ0_05300 [Staphylococcus aureus]